MGDLTDRMNAKMDAPPPGPAQPGWRIAEEAGEAFRAWLAAQPDEVQDMSLLDQIDAYAKASA